KNKFDGATGRCRAIVLRIAMIAPLIENREQKRTQCHTFGELMFRCICALVTVISLAGFSRADVSPETARNLYETVTPSLVGVQYTWEYEFGKVDFVAEGVVVSSNGLIIFPLAAISPQIPDVQLTDFK